MTIRFALDTSVVSETSKKNMDLNIVLWLARVRRALLPMGVITELQQGIYLRAQHDINGAVKLAVWLEDLLSTGIKVAETDTRVAAKYGEMRACKAIRHLDIPAPTSEKIGGQDLHIASAAIAHGLCVATLNARHFLLIHRYFPLPGLYDPRFDHWYVWPGSRQVCMPEGEQHVGTYSRRSSPGHLGGRPMSIRVEAPS